MANQQKRPQGGGTEERQDRPRDPGGEQPGRREDRKAEREGADRDTERREDEGWSEPESSAQKLPEEP